jgi:tetratricopeptide (TPR) repeat protein
MKIIASFIVSAMMFTGVVNAQNSKVTTAANASYAGEYDKAKAAIDEAILNEKTGVEAKTWYYRGDIHNQICLDTTGKYSNIVAPLDAALESFEKALTMPDVKNYKIKISEGLFTTYNLYFQRGANAYSAGNSEEAYQNFSKANKANLLQIQANPISLLDTGVVFNMGLMAERTNRMAEAIKTYQSLVDMKYGESYLYSRLSNLYMNEGRSEEALKVLEAGRANFPADKDIMIAELNYYLTANKLDLLVSKLENAIALDPKNTELYFVLGTTHGELIKLDSTNAKQHFNAALTAYDKALALDNKRYDINLNAGALYYNTAIELNKKMNELPLEKEKEYETLKVERNKLYSSALPYFEKAHEIDPTSTDCMLALKEIYVRLELKEKADEMKKKLGN